MSTSSGYSIYKDIGPLKHLISCLFGNEIDDENNKVIMELSSFCSKIVKKESELELERRQKHLRNMT